MIYRRLITLHRETRPSFPRSILSPLLPPQPSFHLLRSCFRSTDRRGIHLLAAEKCKIQPRYPPPAADPNFRWTRKSIDGKEEGDRFVSIYLSRDVWSQVSRRSVLEKGKKRDWRGRWNRDSGRSRAAYTRSDAHRLTEARLRAPAGPWARSSSPLAFLPAAAAPPA